MLPKWIASSKAVRYLPAVAAGFVGLVTPGLSYGQATPRVLQQIDDAALVTLKGGTHPFARPRFDRGPVEDSLTGRMLLVLKRSPEQQAALEQLIQDQQNPGSPNYHKWLTPEGFGERFGVADADLQNVRSYLEANGFGVGRVYKNKSAIELTGTAGQLRATFHTQIHSYSVNGHEFYANAKDPQIPAALAPVVRGFAALNNFGHATQVEHTPVSMQVEVDPNSHHLKPAYTGNVGAGTFYLVTPSDLQTIYHIQTGAANLGKGGSGVTVGVIGDSQINLDLVKRYQTLSGLPANPPQEIVDGPDPVITPATTATEDATIAYEQIELINAAAPNATVNYYTSNGVTTYDSGLNFAIIRAVEDNAVSVLTIGFQSCEANLTAVGNLLVGDAWLQAAAQGITVVAAAGDSGAAGCDLPGSTTSSGGLAVNGYASTPYNTAVGGTDFWYGTPANPAAYWSGTNGATYGSALGGVTFVEQAWNDSVQTTDYVQAPTLPVVLYAGGGGLSTLGSTAADDVTQSPWPVPSWQVNAQKVSGIASPTVRSIPDVAMFAGNDYNATNYVICAAAVDCNGTLPTATVLGGTAGSAGVFAGVMAQVVAQYGAQGNANPALYALASTAGIFNDVVANGGVKSNTSVTCSGGTGCTAGTLQSGGKPAYQVGTGYDLATGLGSVNVTNLVKNWAVPATTATTTALSIVSELPNGTCTVAPCTLSPGASVVHGTFLDMTATVNKPAATGNVGFTTNSGLPGDSGAIAEPLTSGTAKAPSFDLLPGGTYTVSARYGGDSTYLPSVGTFALTVTPEPSHILFLNGSGQLITPVTTSTSVVYGTKVSFTVEPFSLNYNNVSTPTGTIGVYNGGADPITVLPVSSEGTATFATNLLGGSQTYNLTFDYSGDASYQISTTAGTPYSVTVTQAPTTMTLASSGAVGSNAPITVTAVIASTAAIATGVPPTGTVTFNTTGGNTVAAVTSAFNTSGQAVGVATIQLTEAQLPAGGTLTATYSSDANYSAQTGTIAIGTNNNGVFNSTLSQTLSSNPVTTTGPLTINVTATGRTSSLGTVQFYANGALLGNATTNAAGVASFTVPLTNGSLPFPSGTVAITSIFTPNLSAERLASTTTNLTVTDSRTPGDFGISTETQTQTINSTTNQAYFKVQLASVQNFAGLNTPISLTCNVLPAASNLGCSLGNNYVTIGSSGIAITTLEVYGQPTGGTGALHPPVQPQRWWLVGGGSALACVFLIGIPARRKGLQGWMALMVCGLLISGSIMGCGTNSVASNALLSSGGGSTRNGGSLSADGGFSNGHATNMVAPGTYSVVITGTAAANTTITHNTTVSVVVTTGVSLANGSYSFLSFDTGTYMTNAGASTTSGSGLTLYPPDGTGGVISNDQKWIFTYQNNGYYTIQNAASLLYVTDPGGQTGIVQVQQQTANGAGTQLWTLNALEGGYEVVNATSGGVLDDDSFGTAPGTPVICYPQKNIIDGINQSWYIQPAP